MERLKSALKQIDDTFAFAASGTVPGPLPTLKVLGIGDVALPLSPEVAGELIGMCERAPYGKGEQTLVDTSVRSVWQLSPEHFSVGGESWLRSLDATGAEMVRLLGLTGTSVALELYKLLVYEKGSFFLPHRDTEKAPGMFGTLVVVLPSAHSGGDLKVHHGDETFEFRSDETNAEGQSAFVAFYADCRHEIAPLTGGYRLCLVYNLIASAGSVLPAPATGPSGQVVFEEIGRWAKEDRETTKLVHVLDHRYTLANLKPETLKSRDRIVAGLLWESAKASGCEAYLGILSLHEVAAGDIVGNRRWGRGRDDDDHDVEDFEEHDVVESDLTAHSLVPFEGEPPWIERVQVDEAEIVSEHDFKSVEPDEVSINEATGNEGATMERTYRRAAVIVWPKRRRLEVETSGDRDRAIARLGELVRDWRRLGGTPEEHRHMELRDFAAAILRRWPRTGLSDAFAHVGVQRDLFDSVAWLDDDPLSKASLEYLGRCGAAGDEGAALARIAARIGWGVFQTNIAQMVQVSNRLSRAAAVLADLWESAEEAAEKRAALSPPTWALLRRLEEQRAKRQAGPYFDSDPDQEMDAMLRNAGCLADPAFGERLTQTFDAARGAFDPCKLAARLTALKTWTLGATSRADALAPIIAHVAKVLITAGEREIVEPTDWRRASKLRCDCEDCADLAAFLRDPGSSEYRVKAAESRRRHLESQVQSRSLDLACQVIRTGSPHTLFCRKTKRSYERAVARRELERKSVTSLKAAYPNACPDIPDASMPTTKEGGHHADLETRHH